MAGEYKVPLHASGPIDLKGGRPLAPGESVKLTAEQIKENKDLIDEGKLVAIPSAKGGDK